MKHLLIILLFTVSSAAFAATTSFTFTCDHAGLGNDNISGEVIRGDETAIQRFEYNETSDLENSFSAPLLVKSFSLSQNKLSLAGYFVNPDGQLVEAGLELTGDFDEGVATGKMKVGEREPGIADGNCSFGD